MGFTKPQLEAKNKASLVALVMDQDKRIEALSSGPLTADMVKAENLSLKAKVIEIKDARATKKEAHQRALAEIKKDADLKTKELELKYASEDGEDAKELDNLYNSLESRAKKASSDLSFGLEVAENEANIKLSEINQKVEKAQEKFDETIKSLAEQITIAKEKNKDSLVNIKTEHERTVEQTKYENKIALRDLNEAYAYDAAEKLGLEILEKSKYNELKEFKESSEEEVNSKIEEAVKQAKAEVHRTEGAKYSKLESNTASEIALLKNDKAHLTSTNEALQKRIADLEAQVKEFPVKIAEAVGAAKADITVNQDAAKK